MPTDSGENRRPAKQNGGGGGGGLPQPPPEQEHLPCPRCDSTNTKFCYYNNYNFSQPRHFCKSCRRYWTHGGTLRDIPVGGGSRKNAKRSRTCSSYYTASAVTSAGISSDPLPATPVLMSLAGGNGYGSGGMQFGGDLKGSNVNVYGGRSFTSLLNSTQGGPGFLALGGGFGLGLGNGLHDMGFGVGKAVWPFTEIGFISATGGGGNGNGNGNDNNNGNNGVVGSVNAWQSESGGGGFVEGDCFSWPAISTPGNGLK